MEEFLKTHNIEGLQQARAFSVSFPYHNSQKASESERREIKDIIRQKKYNKSGSDIVTLDSNGNKTLYLIDHSSHSVFLSNEKEDKKRGVENDLFGIREVYNIDKLSSDDIREIIKNISPAYEYSSGRVLHALQTVGLGQKHLLGINLATELKRAADSNDVFHGKNRGIWNKRWLRYDNSNSRKSSGNEGNLGQEGIETFTTPQGEVYGFVDKDGNIYLDETKISPEHPIHEYTHLWDRTVQKHNPKLWNRGVELMKQSSLWNDVLNDEHYGKQWQSMNLPKERLENLIASEVHARIVGENGEKLLNNIAKRNGQSGIVAKLKQWVLDMWKEVKATFGSWSQEDLDALTLNDFNHMTVRDFVDSTNLKDATDASYTEQQFNRFKTVNEVWENLGGYFEGAGLNINKDFPNASKEDISTLEDNYMAPDRYPLSDKQIIEIGNRIVNSNTINNGTEEYKTTDEFRRVQEAVRGSGKQSHKASTIFEGDLTRDQRQRLANVLRRELGSIDSFIHGSSRTVVNQKHGTSFKVHSEVNPELFHDIFEVVRYYTINGELVDLHDDYSKDKCFLTEDGTAGFAVEPNGNLISVFNLGTERGFLRAARDIIKEAGANHLDAYASSEQNLELMYEKALGFHTASTMDYNMEYDHDDIAKNHGNPQVVFMVDNEVKEPKHFDKDSYDAAQQYQMKQLKEQNTVDSNQEKTINIYAGTNENAHLSNFAERPFVLDQQVLNDMGITDDFFFNRDFSNVEDAFQAMKLAFVKDPNDMNDRETKMFNLQDASGARARSIGRSIKFLDRGTWDANSSKIMKALIKASFMQNTDAAKALLDTGNATLTHIQDKGKWGKEFPKLLMEVRDELKGSLPSQQAEGIQEASESQSVSLPGYEWMKSLYDETTVDAAWKMPYLRELDAKIDRLNSLEENQVIVDKIDNLLQATSETEYLNERKRNQVSVVDAIISEYEKLNRHIDNLYNNDVNLSATEVRHVAEQIMNSISDDITRLQKEEGLAEKWFPTLSTDLDFQHATRRQIVETVGINNLIQRAREVFANADYEDLDTILQADLISENWDALMQMGADHFAFNEGFGISKDFRTGNYTAKEQTNIDVDNFNDWGNDKDVASENSTKDDLEKWQIDAKTVDVLYSMSTLVKQGLHECFALDEDGNKKLSKWGIPERVNPREATNSILRWTKGSMSLSNMVSMLSNKQLKHPWLGQLIKRLSDKTGNETDFQSQFYGVFTKDFQLYSIVLLEDGKYYSMLVNKNPVLTDAMQSITTQFKTGEHPLFKDNKVNIKLLGTKNTTGKDADFNLYKALVELQIINDRLKHGEDLTEAMTEDVTKNVIGVCRVLGFSVTDDILNEVITKDSINDMAYYLEHIVTDLSTIHQSQLRGENKDYDPFKFKGEHNIAGTLRNFLSPITDVMEDTGVNAFYDSGKMYQSYIAPSFMTRMFNKFHQTDRASFEKFMQEEYGSSQWFKKDVKGGYDVFGRGWRNNWLRLLAKDENARKIFDHKVELNFNKHNYMRNMTDAEYTLSIITEYFSEPISKDNDMRPVWYRVPMQSNKPSSDFVKFYSYTGMWYKDSIVSDLHSIYLQELDRIATVRRRNRSKNDPDFIKNFDTNGRKFCFLPVLNAYLEDTVSAKSQRDVIRDENNTPTSENEQLYRLMQKKLEGKEKLSTEEEVTLDKLVDKVLYQDLERKAQNTLKKWKQDGIVEIAKRIKDIGEKELIEKNLETFIWNDFLASKMILELTVGDIAFYKDADDLQKRLAQLHAPGTRANIYATDYNGNPVSDGIYRTAVLRDFDNFVSNIVANIAEVFDRKIAAAPDSEKAAMRALKESLTKPRVIDPKTGKVIDKGGKFWNINVADAQGLSSPSSYRKKAFMFGKWNKQAEEIYQKLLSGEYNYTDLETAFQPLKPFVYSKLLKNVGVTGTPIQTMYVPFQAKNSEYLLIMADAILKGEHTSRPNLLRAIYRVMEDSAKRNPTKGIDTIQFESAIKSGLQGALDINQFLETKGGEDAAYTFMMEHIYKNGTNDYNTDSFVYETSFDGYCLQQEIPEHFKEHSQAHGSQIRAITPSDLDLYTTDENGNQVDNYYEWNEPDGTHRKVKADDFKKEYEKTIADNIEESLNDLRAKLHLDSTSKKERNIALSKILQDEIISSPRYGIDLLQACSIDKKTGEFRIPKGDPIQAKRIEQLINSIIKNNVNKQKIAGGPIVQVTNFGTSRQLHIRFNDRKSNLIPLEEEYKAEEHEGLSYKEFLKKNQGGIAYFEVFAPIWSKDLIDKFSNPDGTINVEAINAISPEILKMVSYRIPTEDKYSCAPMKVVGIMPREAGDAIMFPYELTEIDDSDFDIDKRYVMLKELLIKTKRRGKIQQELMDRAFDSYIKSHNLKSYGDVSSEVKKNIKDRVKMFMDNPMKMKNLDAFMQSLYSEYQKVAYYVDAPTSGRTYRNNKIVDMTYAVLTNPMTADKILNPGGFDNLKRIAYMIEASRNPENKVSWDELQNMSVDELKEKSAINKDLTYIDTQIQYYKQNAAASSLIGVFAVNKVAHAILEGDDIWIAVDEICGETPFTIVGTTFGGKMQIDVRYDSNGNLIGKVLGSGVSASADAAKEPILNLMNINMTTVNIFTTMVRIGMPFNDAALFLSQNVVSSVLDEFNRENLNNYRSLDSIINDRIYKIAKHNGITQSAPINTESITKEELLQGLSSDENTSIDYKVLLAFQKIKTLADKMRNLNFATRFNSISSSVGPLIIDNLIMEHKMEEFLDTNSEDGTGFYTKDNVPVDIL